MYQIAKDSVARDTLGELSASELLILGRGFFMNADTPTEGAQPFPYSDILLRRFLHPPLRPMPVHHLSFRWMM